MNERAIIKFVDLYVWNQSFIIFEHAMYSVIIECYGLEHLAKYSSSKSLPIIRYENIYKWIKQFISKKPKIVVVKEYQRRGVCHVHYLIAL